MPSRAPTTTTTEISYQLLPCDIKRRRRRASSNSHNGIQCTQRFPRYVSWGFVIYIMYVLSPTQTGDFMSPLTESQEFSLYRPLPPCAIKLHRTSIHGQAMPPVAGHPALVRTRCKFIRCHYNPTTPIALPTSLGNRCNNFPKTLVCPVYPRCFAPKLLWSAPLGSLEREVCPSQLPTSIVLAVYKTK